MNRTINETVETVQTIQEDATDIVLAGQHNLVQNGDFDLDRNRYLYTTDYVGGGGVVSADVSEEAFGWFTAAPDTAVESTGSITTGTPNLTITTPDFIAGDASAQIVVEGAGAAGADLITTIVGAPGSTTTATLAANAGTTVTNARVRWRLRTLVEDSTDADADASQTTNTTLKTASHSRYATTISDPDYDKANGWARNGNTNWLVAPMPKNYFKPSTTYFVTFIYRLRAEIVAGDPTYPILPFVGLWDNSAGRRQFLEGQPVDLTAVTVGTPAGTVSRDYFIVFYTNWGETIGSEVTTLATAPNDASFITNSVYVYLSWNQPRGVIRTEIYRKTGAVYKLVGLPYPTSDFRDTNTVGTSKPYTTVTAYPSVDFTRPKALTKSTLSNFAPARTDIWQSAQFQVPVPNDYSKAGLTDKQWLVIGLQEDTTLANAVEIDRISVDDKFGTFSVCSLDEAAKRGLSSAPTSGSQGNTGGTIGGCPTFEGMVEVEKEGEILQIPAIDLINNESHFKIINRYGIAKEYTAKVSSEKQVIYEVTADNGKILRASYNHPCFVNQSDVIGKPLHTLSFNDTILTRNGETASVLSNLRQMKKEYTVVISFLDDEERCFWVNGFGGHNAKSPEDLPF